MNNLPKIVAAGLFTLSLAACSGSDGTSSNAGGSNDASSCVTRGTLRVVYSNDCDFDVNAIIFEQGQSPFLIKANRAVTRRETGNSFGACRVPSQPVLNSDFSNFTCS